MKKRAEEYKAYVKYSFPVVDILGEFFSVIVIVICTEMNNAFQICSSFDTDYKKCLVGSL